MDLLFGRPAGRWVIDKQWVGGGGDPLSDLIAYIRPVIADS